MISLNGSVWSRGFSLVEVVVVMAISSVVALGIMSVMDNAFRGARHASSLNDLNVTISSLQNVLSNATSCTANVRIDDSSAAGVLQLSSAPAPSGTVPLNIAIDSSSHIRSGIALANSDLQITALRWQGLIDLGPDPLTAGATLWQGTVMLGSQKTAGAKSAGLGPDEFHQRILGTLIVSIDGTNKIVSCGSTLNLDYPCVSGTFWTGGSSRTPSCMTVAQLAAQLPAAPPASTLPPSSPPTTLSTPCTVTCADGYSQVYTNIGTAILCNQACQVCAVGSHGACVSSVYSP